MKIKSAEFVKGITGGDKILVDGKFQVALMGRSNVGKSTLINSLTVRNSLARSSSTPGKTIRMDFFLINLPAGQAGKSFYFVDFPGYGFAKRSYNEQEKLTKMMMWYLMNDEVKNRLVMLIIDAKIGITTYDTYMINLFHDLKINFIIVANKIDKIARGQEEKQILKIKEDSQNSEVIPYSSEQKHQAFKLMNLISSYLS